MIILELTDEKFGKGMEAISVIEKKIECLKGIFEEGELSQRKHIKKYDDDEEEYGFRHGYGSRYGMRRY